MKRHENVIIWIVTLIAFVGLLAVGRAILLVSSAKTASSSSSTNSASKKSPVSTTSPKSSTAPQNQTPNYFNKQLYSIDDSNSLWVVVNKLRILNPNNYIPANLVTPNVPLRLSSGSSEMHLRSDTATAVESMFASAKQQGINLMVASGYRSYTEQVALYKQYVAQQGQAAADTQSARPGHSEHQTGLALDVEPVSRQCEVAQCFGALPEGKWIATNAYKYGFIVRYTQNKQNITGYEYEPWHIRYIGTALASQMHQLNTATLEEFFNLPAASNY